MMDFRVRNVVPPGGRYFYTVPETGYYVEAMTETDVINSVTRHMRENDVPLPEDLGACIRDYMCHRLPQGFCFGGDRAAGIKIYTTAEIKDNTRYLVQRGVSQPPGVARDRAETCGKCRWNDRSVCPNCSGLVAWATRLVGGRQTGYEQVLGICAVDGVLVAAKVFTDETGAEGYPAACWRNT